MPASPLSADETDNTTGFKSDECSLDCEVLSGLSVCKFAFSVVKSPLLSSATETRDAVLEFTVRTRGRSSVRY